MNSIRRVPGIRGAGIALAFGIALICGAVAAQGEAPAGARAASAAGASRTGEAGGTPAVVAAAAGNTPVARYLEDPTAMRRGKLLFIGSCGAYCHSTKNVERDAPSLFDCAWRYGGSDQEIHDSIANGVPNTRMPGWKGVLPEGDDDIWKLVAYLRSASTCGAPGA